MSDRFKVDWFKFSIISMCLFGFVIIGSVYLIYFIQFPLITHDNEIWAQFGDFIGGTLSSIFSFLTFLAILYTLHLQREELGLNREELRLSREELRIANSESGNQTRIAMKQLENSIRQKNEEYLLEYMQVLSNLESEIRNPQVSHKIGSALIETFLSSKITVQNNTIVNEQGNFLPVKPIIKYLNCLEYLIFWDFLQLQSETLNTQSINNHRAFSSTYSTFIKSFCNDETILELDKSGVLLKLNISANFPNIVRFFKIVI